MGRSSRHEKFVQLRAEYPYFLFEKQEYSLTQAGLDIRFTFDLAGRYTFRPTLFFPRRSWFIPDDKLAGKLDGLVFCIGMTELVSYWKAACPPRVIIRPFALDPEQIRWWKKLYFNGLGEFFYLNSIETDQEGFMEIEAAGNPQLSLQTFNLEDAVIIPIGGGKDSAVTLDLLGRRSGSIPLIMNPRNASLDTITAGGFSHDHFIEIRRTLDPQLIRLNEEGFLNGHTPFSALLAFVTSLAAVLSGRRHIALSNESSASEATIEGTTINHQYSKSFGFESDFREYLSKWISRDINYFSFLRPVSELQIASIFARLPWYHRVFKSCNTGSKTDSWCGQCGKCLFTRIMLAPFLEEEKLREIFGKDLFADTALIPVLEHLTGLSAEKPFDCVGTIDEVNLALCETIRHREQETLPELLRYYLNSPAYCRYREADFGEALFGFSNDHHLLPEFERLLKEKIQGGSGD